MNVTIQPRKLRGRLKAIASKSDAHRKLICAALCESTVTVHIDEISQDIAATIDCIKALGCTVTQTGGNFTVEHSRYLDGATLNCGESGSTLRFMLPVATAVADDTTFIGEGRLPMRPLSPLRERMEEHGVQFCGEHLPITLKGRLQSGRYELAGNVSSQYITGLLFALPLLEGDSEIVLTTALESKGYVDMTLDALSLSGIKIIHTDTGWKIPGGQKYSCPDHMYAEGDWSNAAFWLCAGALGGDIALDALSASSRQRDSDIVALLRQFGANVSVQGDTFAASGGELCAIEIDARQIPDLVPILAVAACGAQRTTTISGCARLKIKESDRLQTVHDMICALGGRCEITNDSLTVHGTGALRGGTVDCANDHRIAMAAAIASCICSEQVTLVGAQAVNKSYPKFFEHFTLLGGEYIIKQ